MKYNTTQVILVKKGKNSYPLTINTFDNAPIKMFHQSKIFKITLHFHSLINQ